MKTLLLYDEITLLNRERHRNLRLQPASSFSFAAGTHYVPLAAQEFYQAARDYPILFVGEGETMAPLALLGLEEGVNLHIDEQGAWTQGAYVPAFIRRYPFVLATNAEDRFSVCFDAGFEGWNEEEGQPLFDGDGKNTAFLDEVIEFLKGFTGEMNRTDDFVKTLNDMDLFSRKTLNLQHPEGATYRIDDFHAVDEEKFAQLDDKQVLELNQKGYLGLVYAHLISLGSANRLFDSHLKRRQGSPKTHPEPEPELH